MELRWQKCAKRKPGELPRLVVTGPHANLTHLFLPPEPSVSGHCLPPLSLGRGIPGPAHPIKPVSLLQELRVPRVKSEPSLWSLTGYWKGLIIALNSSSFPRAPDVPGPEDGGREEQREH